MPYSSISELPPKVKKVLPVAAQKLWMAAFNASFKKYGEEKAFRIAWAAVKKKFKKDPKRGVWVARSLNGVVVFSANAVMDSAGIARSKDGGVIAKFRIATNKLGKDGLKLSKTALNTIVDFINKAGKLVGRLDEHEKFKKLMNKGLPVKQLFNELQSEDTGIFLTNAKLDGDSVVADVIADDPSKLKKGVSLEFVTPDEGVSFDGEGWLVRQSIPVGFVLTDEPADVGAAML